MLNTLLYLLTGAIAGVLAGLLGIGGGIVVVPMLDILFQYQHFPSEITMHMAVGTSLAIMIFTAMSAAYAYYRRGLIFWPLFYRFSPGLIVGTVVGSIVAREFSNSNLRIAFAIFIIVIAIYLFFQKETTAQRPLPNVLILFLASFCMGIFSGFFGVGGGTLMVPFFVYCNIEMHKATGTSSLCGFPLAIAGTLSLIITGWDVALVAQAPAGSTGFVFWPAVIFIAAASLLCAPLGTRIAVWLRGPVLKRIFSAIMILTAISLLME